MERAEAPDDVGGVYAYDFTVGEASLENISRFVVGQTAVGREDDLVVGDIEVGIGGRQALVVVENNIGHRQLDNRGLFAAGQTAALKHTEIFLQGFVVLIPRVMFDDSDNSIGRHKTSQVVDMAVCVVADDAIAMGLEAGVDLQLYDFPHDEWQNGIRELVNYICVEKKHQKVAYISGDPESEVSKIRLESFKSACKEAGIKVRKDYIKESRFRDIRDVTRKTEELLNMSDPPTCIFFPDDYAAIGGINVIHNRGLEVPKDISYCGYDGVNLVSLLDPQLATVVQDTVTIGVTAARELIQLMDQGMKGDGSVISVPTKLQIGHTVRQLF